ncbi:hypothetical protein HKD37_03G007322 [Glycine soja]
MSKNKYKSEKLSFITSLSKFHIVREKSKYHGANARYRNTYPICHASTIGDRMGVHDIMQQLSKQLGDIMKPTKTPYPLGLRQEQVGVQMKLVGRSLYKKPYQEWINKIAPLSRGYKILDFTTFSSKDGKSTMEHVSCFTNGKSTMENWRAILGNRRAGHRRLEILRQDFVWNGRFLENRDKID